MHELSIVQSVVASVTESLAGKSVGRINSVRLRVGALSGVFEESLQLSWDLATGGTVLAGARLDVLRVPVVIHCPRCNDTAELPGVQSFRCPRCGTPSADIRQGRELEIESVEIEDSD